MKATRGMRRRAAALAIAAMLACAAASAPAPQAAQGEGRAQRAVVERAVDGDTLVVSAAGEEERVRLIGVDCPESVHPDGSRNTPEGKAASEWTAAAVPAGTEVWLVRDVSDRDAHGRLLRYVWLEEPSASPGEQEAREHMLNALLVESGHAVAKRCGPDVAWAGLLERL